MRPRRPPVRFLPRDRVQITFEPEAWGIRGTRSVQLTGSFTAWQPRLTMRRTWGRWQLTLPRAEVAVPGNSGEPEFRIVADGLWLACPDAVGWPRVGDNAVVPLLPVPTDRREQNHRTAQRLKTAFSDYRDTAELANFRPVLDGRLYRSYHPFLTSRETPVEGSRLEAVCQLIHQHQVRAVINLTDQPEVLASDDVPEFYRDWAQSGRVVFAETTYEDAYYGPEGPAFGAIVNRVLAFVADQPGPYLVHCRLGMDRTGVVTALLAGLAGLNWEGVAADYVRSNELGIREYRDQALLAHSFTRMLGSHPAQVPDLAAALKDFCQRQGVSRSTVEQAQAHLTPDRRLPT